MCGEVCQFAGWFGWIVFLLMLACALGWSHHQRRRERRKQTAQEERYEQRLREYRIGRLRPPPPTRTVEIGAMRERVEVLEDPTPPPENRPGRIRHGNGESVTIDFATLQALRQRARGSRRGRLIA